MMLSMLRTEKGVGFGSQMITGIFSVVYKEQTDEQMNDEKIKAVEKETQVEGEGGRGGGSYR